MIASPKPHYQYTSDDFSIDYDEEPCIRNCRDFTLIQNCSDLRHFFKCWGDSDRLISEISDYFRTTPAILSKIRSYGFPGRTYRVSELIDDPEALSELIVEGEKRNAEIRAAEQRAIALEEQLATARVTLCGIGTRKIKIRLNKLAKTDNRAKAYRLALEIEDTNIRAKRVPAPYADKEYQTKNELIEELGKLCSTEGWTWGTQANDKHGPSHIVYFELPSTEQLSWHSDCSIAPKYEGQWDHKRLSTLKKIETAILATYPDITR